MQRNGLSYRQVVGHCAVATIWESDAGCRISSAVYKYSGIVTVV